MQERDSLSGQQRSSRRGVDPAVLRLAKTAPVHCLTRLSRFSRQRPEPHVAQRSFPEGLP
jgi:hypothetical protein